MKTASVWPAIMKTVTGSFILPIGSLQKIIVPKTSIIIWSDMKQTF